MGKRARLRRENKQAGADGAPPLPLLSLGQQQADAAYAELMAPVDWTASDAGAVLQRACEVGDVATLKLYALCHPLRRPTTAPDIFKFVLYVLCSAPYEQHQFGQWEQCATLLLASGAYTTYVCLEPVMRRRHYALMRILLEAGCVVSSIVSKELWSAVQACDTQAVRLLLEYGADPASMVYGPHTMLQWCLLPGNEAALPVASVLMDYGAVWRTSVLYEDSLGSLESLDTEQRRYRGTANLKAMSLEKRVCWRRTVLTRLEMQGYIGRYENQLVWQPDRQRFNREFQKIEHPPHPADYWLPDWRPANHWMWHRDTRRRVKTLFLLSRHRAAAAAPAAAWAAAAAMHRLPPELVDQVAVYIAAGPATAARALPSLRGKKVSDDRDHARQRNEERRCTLRSLLLCAYADSPAVQGLTASVQEILTRRHFSHIFP